MRSDSQVGVTAGFRAKMPADHPEYRERVAVPVMQAVDALPQAYRRLVHEYGYVDVYRAWKRGLPPEAIRAAAERAGGVFSLGF
jgi:hypothetical protein